MDTVISISQKEIDGRLWLNPGSCGQKPLWWRRDHGSYDRGKRQLAGGKNRALNSCNVEKKNIQNTVLQLCCRKIGKNRGENCRKMTLQF